ncbi:uncharacterized protein [Asterias amurensis]|uniref:uncharacterized protein isoform X2 n=1 Tax=Asterias amurensis TaxID=7602 RepID=UPI003AB69B30
MAEAVVTVGCVGTISGICTSVCRWCCGDNGCCRVFKWCRGSPSDTESSPSQTANQSSTYLLCCSCCGDASLGNNTQSTARFEHRTPEERSQQQSNVDRQPASNPSGSNQTVHPTARPESSNENDPQLLPPPNSQLANNPSGSNQTVHPTAPPEQNNENVPLLPTPNLTTVESSTTVATPDQRDSQTNRTTSNQHPQQCTGKVVTGSSQSGSLVTVDVHQRSAAQSDTSDSQLANNPSGSNQTVHPTAPPEQNNENVPLLPTPNLTTVESSTTVATPDQRDSQTNRTTSNQHPQQCTGKVVTGSSQSGSLVTVDVHQRSAAQSDTSDSQLANNPSESNQTVHPTAPPEQSNENVPLLPTPMASSSGVPVQQSPTTSNEQWHQCTEFGSSEVSCLGASIPDNELAKLAYDPETLKVLARKKPVVDSRPASNPSGSNQTVHPTAPPEQNNENVPLLPPPSMASSSGVPVQQSPTTSNEQWHQCTEFGSSEVSCLGASIPDNELAKLAYDPETLKVLARKKPVRSAIPAEIVQQTPRHETAIVTKEQLRKLAHNLGPWDELAVNLGMSKGDIYKLKEEHKNDQWAQVFYMLDKWKNREGPKATVGNLYKKCCATETVDSNMYAFLLE